MSNQNHNAANIPGLPSQGVPNLMRVALFCPEKPDVHTTLGSGTSNCTLNCNTGTVGATGVTVSNPNLGQLSGLVLPVDAESHCQASGTGLVTGA